MSVLQLASKSACTLALISLGIGITTTASSIANARPSTPSGLTNQAPFRLKCAPGFKAVGVKTYGKYNKAPGFAGVPKPTVKSFKCRTPVITCPNQRTPNQPFNQQKGFQPNRLMNEQGNAKFVPIANIESPHMKFRVEYQCQYSNYAPEG